MQKIHRHIFFSVFAGIFFSTLLYFGAKFTHATFEYEAVKYSILDILILIPIIIFASLIFYFLLGLKIKSKEDKNFNLKKWQIFVPLLFISVITFLAFFPGHYPYDSSLMYEDFQASEYTNHYSPLVSFVIGIFLSLGKIIFNSEEIGHAILIILQFIFLDFVLTEAIFYCSKKLKKKSFGIILTIFFALNPLIQTLIIRSGQDTIFGGIFLLLALEFLKISENEKYFLEHKKRKFFYLFILIFFLCAVRNNGIYVLIPVFISGFFILKNKTLKKNFFIAISIPTVIFLGYNYLFVGNIITKKDSFFQETLNIPIMQIARSMNFNPDQETKEELKTYFKENCDTWVNQKWSWENYKQSTGISDPYKNCLITSEIDKDPIKFFNLWAKIGSKNVVNYIEAPFVFTLGLYYPYVPYYRKDRVFMWHKYIDSYYTSYEHYGIKTTSFIPPVQGVYNFFISDQAWSKIPVLRILWGAPFTTHLCLILILLALYRKKYYYLLPLSLIFGLILTVALSPVMLFRYIFPAVICLPIMLYIGKSVLK